MKRILIVVDMQNDFITGELPAEGADKIIPNVVKKMTQKWDLVYLTRDTHYGGSYEESLEGKNDTWTLFVAV